MAELRLVSGADRRLDAAVESVGSLLASSAGVEAGARSLVERMAVVWAATLLVQHAPPEVADAFVATRVTEPHGPLYGTLPAGMPLAVLARRAHPVGIE